MRQLLCFCLGGALWAVLAWGCGYRPIYAAQSDQHYSVQVGQSLVPEALAVQAASAGARAELATSGQLAPSSGWPRVVMDVLRVDEVSRGVHVQDGRPLAAGMSIAVVVRARVFAGDNQEPALDTGDLRRAVQLTGAADARADSTAHDAALRSAAERAGRAAARVVMGIPEPADEAP